MTSPTGRTLLWLALSKSVPHWGHSCKKLIQKPYGIATGNVVDSDGRKIEPLPVMICVGGELVGIDVGTRRLDACSLADW